MANWNLYDIFREKQVSGNGSVNIESLTVKCMLVTSGYAVNQNTHDFRDDLGANEVSGDGYTAGGATVATVTVTLDGAGGIKADGDESALSWAQQAGGFTNARKAILYIARGGASSADELIAYSDDFGADKGNVDGPFSILFDAAGIFTSAR